MTWNKAIEARPWGKNDLMKKQRYNFKTQIYINPEFFHLEDFIKKILESFDAAGQEIKSGKTGLKVYSTDGIKLTVKRFNDISIFHRMLSSTIGKSKARSAYENSQLLIKKGFPSPRPVAYVNIYRRGILHTCYYISLYTDRIPIKELFSAPIPESEKGLRSFAKFTYNLHQNGIFHGDYRLSNVFYEYDGFNYDFSLIDNDSIRLGRYSMRRGMRNLRRLSLPADKLAIIATEYACLVGTNELIALNTIIFFRLSHTIRKAFRKWIKKYRRHAETCLLNVYWM